MRARIAYIVASALLVLAIPSAASAAITVATTNDSGPGSLRQAIADAPPGETIVVPAGTYTLTSGQLAIEKPLTISGSGAGSTAIGAGGLSRVVYVEGDFAATISGVTIRDGRVQGVVAIGGGIVNSGADLTLRGVNVTNNLANANGAPGSAGGVALGGGIYSEAGSLNLIDSRVAGNVASAVGGNGRNGGVALGGGVSANASTIVGSTISGNLADARGGQGPANAEQDGSVATGGGLIINTGSFGGASVSQSTIADNVADASAGPGGTGGQGFGGGVAVSVEGDPISLANVTVASNAVRGSSGGDLFGGGVYAEVDSGPNTVSLASTTISGNRIDAVAPSLARGGNLDASAPTPGQVTIANSIVTAGAAPGGFDNCSPEIVNNSTSLGFNIDSRDQCGFRAAGDRVDTDPLLGPLQTNGGPTATMAPALNSPAIDQGSSFGLGTDQRGVLRPIDLPSIPNPLVPGANGADIGAFELQPSNAFALGKLKRNRRKGTATLVVSLPQPSAGVLTLAGKGLKAKTVQVAGQSTVTFKVLTKKGKVRRALRKRGKRKVKISVTYAPTGNAAATRSRTTKLVKKQRPGKQGQRR